MAIPVRCMAVAVLASSLAACAVSEPASIVSSPDGVSVSVNGKVIGTAPTKYRFVFAEEDTRYTVRGSKEGYHDSTAVVSALDLSALGGTVSLTLEPHRKPAVIVSDPGQALVKVGSEEVGRTPVEYAFDFSDRASRYLVTLSKPGYFDRVLTVTERSAAVRSGRIGVTLEENPAWTTTTESEATNKWLRIAVDPAITYEDAWQKIIDSVTSVYDSLEQLDQASGYLRSSPKLREFPKGPEGPFFVRTQFIGSISSKAPLTYKIKLISRTRLKSEAAEHWKEFDRVFAEDAQLVEEMQNRLGLK